MTTHTGQGNLQAYDRLTRSVDGLQEWLTIEERMQFKEALDALLTDRTAALLEALEECNRVLCHVDKFDPSVDRAIRKTVKAIAAAKEGT